MLTHMVFGAGTAAALGATLRLDLLLPLAVVLSLGVNLAIDELGHTTRGGFLARSPLTHSIFTAPVWGGAVGYVAWRAGTQLGLLLVGLDWSFVLLGAGVAGSHLLLDSLTERGVFIFTRRAALAHFGSRNLLLNAAFVLIGFALFLFA